MNILLRLLIKMKMFSQHSYEMIIIEKNNLLCTLVKVVYRCTYRSKKFWITIQL